MAMKIEAVTLGLSEVAILEYIAKTRHNGNKSETMRALLNRAAQQEGIEAVPVKFERKAVQYEITRTAPMGA